MRLTLDPRAARLLRRLPLSFPYAVAEVLLLALIAIQVARFLWAVAAPVGPFGDWRPAHGGAIGGDATLLARFDPFFRLSGAAQAAVVTSLSLKLYGTRVDSFTGRGSAIIATPDGIQSSYAVGDEIVPGVKLKAVAFDGVTIDRGGAPEQLFLDQSVVAPVAQPAAAAPAPPLVATPA
ncbi:MAG: type II secretory protein PulC, partial [Sphingomonadaceae bacterium]|nr:type II secretory protein PulC [Sphingomonadaceae bacterium]